MKSTPTRPGTDTAEFVELYDGGAGNTPLDGLVVVFFNGSNDLSYAAFDLDGFTTDAQGYFTLGNPGVPGVDLIFDPGAAGLLQNGADAVALFAGNATDFPNGTAVTTTNLQDAIVYDTDDADDAGLLALLNAGAAAGQRKRRRQRRDAVEPALSERHRRRAQHVDVPAGRADARWREHLPAAAAAEQQRDRDQPAVRRRRQRRRHAIRTTTSSCTTAARRRWTSAAGRCSTRRRPAAAGTSTSSRSAERSARASTYLIALASGGADGAPLPPANISGQINMSGTSGKIALVNSFDGLVGNCPIGDPHVMDFVGYGSADCREGTTTAPAPSNTHGDLPRRRRQHRHRQQRQRLRHGLRHHRAEPRRSSSSGRWC